MSALALFAALPLIAQSENNRLTGQFARQRGTPCGMYREHSTMGDSVVAYALP